MGLVETSELSMPLPAPLLRPSKAGCPRITCLWWVGSRARSFPASRGDGLLARQARPGGREHPCLCTAREHPCLCTTRATHACLLRLPHQIGLDPERMAQPWHMLDDRCGCAPAVSLLLAWFGLASDCSLAVKAHPAAHLPSNSAAAATSLTHPQPPRLHARPVRLQPAAGGRRVLRPHHHRQPHIRARGARRERGVCVVTCAYRGAQVGDLAGAFLATVRRSTCPLRSPLPRHTSLCPLQVFSPEFGMGAQAVLSQHRHRFSGVLNGIDHESWCAEADAFLPAHFSAADTAGKEACKRLLLEELALPYTPPDWAQQQQGQPQLAAPPAASGAGQGAAAAPAQPGRPLLAVVSRLTVQKGLPLILHGIRTAISRGAQVGAWTLGCAPALPEPQRQRLPYARNRCLKICQASSRARVAGHKPPGPNSTRPRRALRAPRPQPGAPPPAAGRCAGHRVGARGAASVGGDGARVRPRPRRAAGAALRRGPGAPHLRGGRHDTGVCVGGAWVRGTWVRAHTHCAGGKWVAGWGCGGVCVAVAPAVGPLQAPLPRLSLPRARCRQQPTVPRIPHTPSDPFLLRAVWPDTAYRPALRWAPGAPGARLAAQVGSGAARHDLMLTCRLPSAPPLPTAAHQAPSPS
jgi:hypothetical protein